jgi:hypothetical protein
MVLRLWRYSAYHLSGYAYFTPCYSHASTMGVTPASHYEKEKEKP